jgi:hypothetical protein
MAFKQTKASNIWCTHELHHEDYASSQRHLSLGELKECESNDVAVQRHWVESLTIFNAPEMTIFLCAPCHLDGAHTAFHHSPRWRRRSDLGL